MAPTATVEPTGIAGATADPTGIATAGPTGITGSGARLTWLLGSSWEVLGAGVVVAVAVFLPMVEVRTWWCG